MVGPTPDEIGVRATVDLASIDTGNADRDAHVRSPELLDVAARPTVTITSTGVHGSGSDRTLEGDLATWRRGDLAIGGAVRPLTLEVELGGVEPFFDGTRHAGFEGKGEMRRKEFGLGFGPLGAMLGDVVRIEIDLQFVEPR